MKTSPLFVCLAAAGLAATAQAQPRNGPSVDLYDAAARMVVIPEARRDVDVRITPGDARLPTLRPSLEGGRVRIDGGLARRIRGCGIYGANWGRAAEPRVRIEGLGEVPRSALPLVTVRVPLDAAVGASGAVWGEVGPSDSLDLAHGGCGDWTVAPVRGAFNLSVVGSGDTRARTAGSLHLAVNGSGDLAMDAVRLADIAIRGSGDAHIGRIDGPLTTSTAGSGDIRIDGGRAPNMAVRVAGSGDVVFGGAAGALSAQVAGSGDVHVAHVTGPVSKQIAGSGTVTIGR